MESTQVEKLIEQILHAAENLGGVVKLLQEEPHGTRFLTAPKEMILGRPKDAAIGLNHFLGVDDDEIIQMLAKGDMAAIMSEFTLHGTDEDRECLHYCLHERAGANTKRFWNGVRDENRNGETLDDFLRHENSVHAGLRKAHVLALRLYSTAAYKSLNGPLRARGTAHVKYPFPVTMHCIAEALRRLRAVGATIPRPSGREAMALYRGMRGLSVPDIFLVEGGTEISPMSTTCDLEVAVRYSASRQAVLIRLNTSSFMQRGADISYLSAFPAEAEILFPPLTYLECVAVHNDVAFPLDGDANGSSICYTLVDCIPHFGS